MTTSIGAGERPRGPGRAVIDFIDNVVFATRLAFFFGLKRCPFHASTRQLIWILSVTWLLALTIDYLEIGPGAEFSIWGLSIEAARGYFWLAAIAVIVVIDGRSGEFPRLATAAAYSLLPIWLAWLVTYEVWMTLSVTSFERYRMLAWWAVFSWQVVVFWRVLATPYGARRRRATALSAVYAMLLYAIIFAFPESPLFNEAADLPAGPPLDIEGTYYRQPELADAMLAEFAPGRPGVSDLYFIGFGGDANQAVFMREIRQVRALFDRHFGTQGRSGMLINNRETIEDVPLANRHNLARVISGLAGVMNREEDILFLFITSHGSEYAYVSVEFAPLGLNNLTASELRAMLDRSGIRWRVIVVSACYSGSFIKYLETPGTLIMTAAAADRTSFGCSNERDWTYFGEAFFNQAAARTDSFVAAFADASAIIEQRERREGISPSKPQISIGSDIEAPLARWREQLAAGRVP